MNAYVYVCMYVVHTYMYVYVRMYKHPPATTFPPVVGGFPPCKSTTRPLLFDLHGVNVVLLFRVQILLHLPALHNVIVRYTRNQKIIATT